MVGYAKTEGRAFHVEELTNAGLEKALTQSTLNLGVVNQGEQPQMRLLRKVGPAARAPCRPGLLS